MASAFVPVQKSLVHEGGYAPAFGPNGETYKGIDRKQQPGWPGWKIIDAIKSKRKIQKYEVINNAQLDQLVVDFYVKNFWPRSNAGLIENQTFANNYFDFYFHKPAIAVAALLDATGKKDIYTAITAANADPVTAYEKFYDLRVAHYKNNYRNGSGKNRIYYSPNGTQKTQLRRAQSYPDTLSGFVGVSR